MEMEDWKLRREDGDIGNLNTTLHGIYLIEMWKQEKGSWKVLVHETTAKCDWGRLRMKLGAAVTEIRWIIEHMCTK